MSDFCTQRLLALCVVNDRGETTLDLSQRRLVKVIQEYMAFDLHEIIIIVIYHVN